MGSQLLIVLGAAWLVANGVVGILAMLGVRSHHPKPHPGAQSLTGAPVAGAVRDALAGDGETRPSG